MGSARILRAYRHVLVVVLLSSPFPKGRGLKVRDFSSLQIGPVGRSFNFSPSSHFFELFLHIWHFHAHFFGRFGRLLNGIVHVLVRIPCG